VQRLGLLLLARLHHLRVWSAPSTLQSLQCRVHGAQCTVRRIHRALSGT